MAMPMAIERLRNWKCRIFLASFVTGEKSHAQTVCSIAERAAVLARIGTAGERTLVPIDPDRLTAAERGDHAGGLMAELLQALDDSGGGAGPRVIRLLIVAAAPHI